MNLFDKIAALNAKGPFRAERVTAETALKGGRHPVLPEPQPNAVLGTPLQGADDAAWNQWLEQQGQGADLRDVVIGVGCFWGGEEMFWGVEGIVGTSVGYAGGYTQNPTYREVCTGRTGHAEVTRVVFDAKVISAEEVVAIAFENHDPTQGDKQGNDIGTQYRSAVYANSPEQLKTIEAAIESWRERFAEKGFGDITTEVGLLADTGDGHYYLAEDEHQQYLHKNPGGYCNHGPNGVSCPTGVLG
ncbi:peptide-methionine (S)-S-oxide reductase MsrA [Corynebacterium auriscanis]|uniref:peptide-methionine (S)-S-oxide reductase MsrA n=1 Tax=Corynebacterium auriscanis TaxID=99807 RepID=UPI0024AD0F23|nr:peptide-methionine (S)-S-oxide reductase MsrA [Corynebacterium auriscanis]